MSTNSTFIQEYPGTQGLEQAMHTAGTRLRSFSASRGLSTVLLAAMLATLLLVADLLMDTWAEGHLMAAWVMTWVIGFAVLALLAPVARGMASRAVQGLDAWSRELASRRADERLWALAQKDQRLMADLRAATSRAEVTQDADVETSAPAFVASMNAGRDLSPATTARLERLSRRIWNE
jgi:hypothetical protein